MSVRTHRVAALFALLVLGALLVFWRLESGPFFIWDEGLYGRYGRNALSFGRYLHALNEQGDFSEGKFSKPPLTIWLSAAAYALGAPSQLTLRLPFACATVGVALLLFAWGPRLVAGARGIWLGFAAGTIWLSCHGIYLYGRTANIETVLICFLLAALYAHSRALDETGARALWWAAGGGVAAALAFLTKQIVCILAVVPIVAIELGQLHRQGLRRPALRLSLSLGILAATAGTWIALVARSNAEALHAMLWKHAVVNRVQGYPNKMHENFLNRVAQELASQAAPFGWAAGVLAFALLLASLPAFTPSALEPSGAGTNMDELNHGRVTDPRRNACLLALMFGAAWISFDVVAGSILPWYVLSLMPVICLGLSWALLSLIDLRKSVRNPASLLGAGIAMLSLAEMAIAATKTLAPSVLVVMVVGGAVALAVALQRASRAILISAVVGVLCLVALQLSSRTGYRNTEAEGLSTLARSLHGLGARTIALDPHLKIRVERRVTFLGTRSLPEAAPWKLAKSPFDAWVGHFVAPRELHGGPDLALARAPGLTGFQGDLRKVPLALEQLETKVQKRPLTFEAEDLVSERFDSLSHASGASGRALRSVEPSMLRPDAANARSLAKGRTCRLPAGKYTATFYVRAACQGDKAATAITTVARLSIAGGNGRAVTRALHCKEATPRDKARFAPIALTTELPTGGSFELAVNDVHGPFAFDRVVLAWHPREASPAVEKR